MGVICIDRNTTAVDELQVAIKYTFDLQSRTKSVSTTSETPLTCVYFHVYKKNYPVSPGQHILMILVSFESQLNKAINKGFLMMFRHCIFYIQQVEFL